MLDIYMSISALRMLVYYILGIADGRDLWSSSVQVISLHGHLISCEVVRRRIMLEPAMSQAAEHCKCNQMCYCKQRLATYNL